jgi:hypothetical protein
MTMHDLWTTTVGGGTNTEEDIQMTWQWMASWLAMQMPSKPLPKCTQFLD